MKNKKLFLTFILIALLTKAGFISPQQKPEQMAFGGPNGIFVNLGVELLSPQENPNKAASYKIERKSTKENSWLLVANISAPVSYDDFLNRVYQLNMTLQDSIPADELPLQLIWEKAQRYGRLDSLKYLANPLIVRLSLGVCYLDKDAQANMNYIYKVTKVSLSGNDIESFITNQVSFPVITSIGKPSFASKDVSDNYVKLNWIINYGTNPARFKVFRRSNFEGEFNEINVTNIILPTEKEIKISVIDTTVQRGTTYEYFITPVDYYQNIGQSSDTVTTAAFNFGSIFPPYNISVLGLDTLGALKIEWSLDNSNKILSLKIFRSTNYDSGFVEIAEVPASDTFYVDRTAIPMIKYFYFLQLNDQFGETIYNSAKVFGLYKSSLTPMPPMNLRSIETIKGVKLTWEKPEEFIHAYHIYRSFGEEESLVELSSVFSTDSTVEFIDTSSFLTRNMVFAYSVRAENTSGVLSDFSDTLYIVPNAFSNLRAPYELKGYAEDNKVFLYWENMFEVNETIAGYQVYRRIKSLNNLQENNFVSLFDSLLSPKQNNYVDITVSEGVEYEYSIKSFDIYGNQSELSSVIVINIPDEIVLPPSGLTAISSDDGIILKWQPPMDQQIKNYKLFRYQRGQNPENIALVKSEQPAEFIDKQAEKGELYFYFIKSVSLKNIESESSDEIGVRR